eukprot:9170266-Karenia_brevis.AAC.1
MSDMELMMRRLLNEHKEEIKGEIQSNMRALQSEVSDRLENVERACLTNESAINEERDQREKLDQELRSEIADLKSKITELSRKGPPSVITSSNDRTKSQQEPICVIGGFHPSDRDTVRGLLQPLLHGVQDAMWNFQNGFKEVARSNTKLWCAPKRKQDDTDDPSQIVLNKIKRAICESTTCPGNSIKIDRKVNPRVVYKLHNGALIEVAKVD